MENLNIEIQAIKVKLIPVRQKFNQKHKIICSDVLVMDNNGNIWNVSPQNKQIANIIRENLLLPNLLPEDFEFEAILNFNGEETLYSISNIGGSYYKRDIEYAEFVDTVNMYNNQNTISVSL